MRELWQVPLRDGTSAHIGFTLRADGDLAVTQDAAALEARRAGLVDRPWLWLRQVHGVEIVVAEAGEDVAALCGMDADAALTRRRDIALSVNVADCAPVALVGSAGMVAAVHAGWRGLAAGVLGATVGRMRALGSGTVKAYLGPCIHPECYEFGAEDLDQMVERFGPAVRARTSRGRVALDLPTAVAAALGKAAVELVDSADQCTACDATAFFSHRARGDLGRHALVVWLDEGARSPHG